MFTLKLKIKYIHVSFKLCDSLLDKWHWNVWVQLVACVSLLCADFQV